MRERPTFYVGLASSFHDPSVAVVDAKGRVMFAEATERRLQDKRAINAPPDLLNSTLGDIRNYVPDRAKVVLSTTWSQPYRLRELTWLARGHTSSLTGLKWLVPTHNSAVGGAGRNLAHRARMAAAASESFDWEVERRRQPHHLCHAVTAAFTAPFSEGLAAVVDGAGQGTSVSFFSVRGNDVRQLRGTSSVCSLGLFYALLCEWCGFDSFKGEEWKVMGLASFGEVDPQLYESMAELVGVRGMKLVYGLGRKAHAERLELLSRRSRLDRASSDDAPARWAATGQAVFEATMTKLLSNAQQATGERSLMLGGGCALNSSYNGKIVERTGFERVHVYSAPADDGNAIGAAWLAALADGSSLSDLQRPLTPYLGSEITASSLEHLQRFSPRITARLRDPARTAADLIADGHVVGWVQGRAEFGPRALGNRSILADARDSGMLDRINSEVKFREGFRPVAPSILADAVDDYFHHGDDSPYMERTLPLREAARHLVPAVSHVDGSARLQVVREDWNPMFADLLMHFRERTGVPLVVNTSLNVMGKPIVDRLEDATAVLLSSGVDALILGDVLVSTDDRILQGYAEVTPG